MFKDLKIKYKLVILIIIFTVGFLSFGVFSYKTINEIKINGNMYSNIIQGKDLVADILPPPEYIIESYLTVFQMLNENDNSKKEELITHIKDLKSDYINNHNKWADKLPDGDMKKLFVEDSYKQAMDFYDVLENEFIPSIKNDNKEKAKEILDNKLSKSYLEHRSYIDKVVNMANNQNSEIEKDANKTINLDIYILVLIAVVILAITIIFCIIIVRIITKPLNVLTNHLKLVATGDFSVNISNKYLVSKDELGEIANAAYKMQHSVKEIIEAVILETASVNEAIITSNENISRLTKNLNEASTEVKQLTEGIEETSSSTEEITASIVEIEKAVDGISEKAEDGALSANKISEKANKLKHDANISQNNAYQVRLEIDKAMSDAIEKAKEVEKIRVLADAILQISSQTNLLALNAAIEAQRAGESGKGFKVVAEEIRKLAETSKSTVNEIQKTIKVVFDAVNILTKTSKNAVEFIDNEIVKAYSKLVKTGENYDNDSGYIEDLVTELSSTSEELSASIKTVSDVINEIAIENNHGAASAGNITDKISRISARANEVKLEADIIKESSDKLNAVISKFVV